MKKCYAVVPLRLMDQTNAKKRKSHPKERANILSRITFFYTLGIFWRTYKKGSAEEEDLYAVLQNCQSEKLGDELEKHFNNDLRNHGSVSVYRVLWSCYGYEYFVLGFIQLLIRTLVIVSIPMALSKVVLYFQPGQKDLTKKDAQILAALLIFLNFLSVTYLHNYLLYLAEMGIRIRTAFCSVMYRKCLKLTSSLSELTLGKIVTLMTKDVTAIELAIFYGNDAWIGFTQAVVVCGLIYYRMGLAAFVGIGFFFVVMLIQIYVGNITEKFRKSSCKKTDERLQTTQEALSAIKMIKMNVWERFFEKNISDNRKIEMNKILKIYLTKIMLLLLGTLTSKIAFYLLLMTYLGFGHTVTAELLYFISTLFLRIRHALNVAIPVGVTTMADLRVAVNRIEHLMNTKDLSKAENRILFQTKPRVMLNNITVIINGKYVLRNVTFTATSGLTFLSGPLASGKSVLLETILGECDIDNGSNYTYGSISYSSQEPWIFPSSLRQNIIFGQKYDQCRYEEVLRVCDLHFDIQSFAQGDYMVIGDKGTNISKGQKARISLARAIYKVADIYLIDDCLTSLDIRVRKTVLKRCIREFLGDKIVIFVTQNLENMMPGDNLILLQNGTVSSQQIINTELKNNEESDIMNNNNDIKMDTDINNGTLDDIGGESDADATLLDPSKKSLKKNIYQEVKKSGKVPWDVYAKYISYGGGYFVLISILIFFLGTQFAKSYTEKILSNWIDDVHKNEVISGVSNETIADDAPLSSISVVYSSFTLAIIIFSLVTTFSFFNFTRRASVGLHKSMVKGVVYTKMQFFDKNLIGNILNRFSNDLRIIDEDFPFTVFEFFEIFFGILGIIILIASVNMIFLIPTVIISITLFFLRKLYIPTGRNLHRLETTTRSPVIGYLNASLEGLPTIRAFHAERLLTKEFDNHQNLYTSANYTSKGCQRAFGYALDVCCTMFIAFVIGICFIFDKGTSVGNVGLAITQAFTLTSVVQYGIRKWAEIESKITSVERVLEYTNTPQECLDKNPSVSWPLNTTITYNDVGFGYGKKGVNVLRNLSFTINSMEKIGIVGRTGAGKTSIISTLFRLYDYEGTITVGSLDTKNYPIDVLRSNITIIPQDPVLFSGTIRSNIDPFGKYDDDVVWKAIEKVGMKYLFSSLSSPVAGSGSNLSAGQRQLICLARALVSGNRILVLDEATADMDQETERLINKVVSTSFTNCTVIIIAHRLHLVMSCDRVMVIQRGQILEYDRPDILSRKEGGIFRNMLKEAGLLEYECIS